MKKARLLDGAMGTELMKAGIQPGSFSEEVNLLHPQAVRDIHRAYAQAGSDLLYSCTFGANALKSRGADVSAVVRAALENVQSVCAEFAPERQVEALLDVGMLGTLLEPYGELSEERARALYKEIFLAGEAARRIVLETYFDLNEALLALETAKSLFPEKPVFVTMTFQQGGRTLTGVDVPLMVRELEAAGADALGINCSLGPVEALPLARLLRDFSRLPVIVKPNAGMPDPKTGAYPMNPEAFAEAMLPIVELGADYVGGCCGTSPAHIRELAKVIQ